jgi:hypothetical protein
MRINPLIGFRYAIIPIDTCFTDGFPGASAKGGGEMDRGQGESGSRKTEARYKTTRNDATSKGRGAGWVGQAKGSR